MKHIKDLFEGIFDIEDKTANFDKTIKEDIKRFLRENYKGASKCKISKLPNEDGKYIVDCKGSIVVKNKSITNLTNDLFVWGEVDGDFYCNECDLLASLKGAPEKVN